ncbi:MAG TPA: hypothetical protein VGQ43_06285 [Candidatus Udaeobacter sp.]|jgi:hypothetical protein|nr:hypothetical protein [Candidatus Udaeobacter sp.]
MRRSVTLATAALYSEHFDMDDVLRRLADTNDSDQLLFAYIAIQVATNLSTPISAGDIAYGLKLLGSASRDALSLNKELAELGWSEKAQELLNRKAACRADEYSCEAAIYRFEKAKKGPSSYEEREKWIHMAASVAEAREELETYLDDKASREAAESAFQNLLDEVKAQSAESNFNTEDSQHWLERLAQPELAHWEAKPQSEKEWWYANTKPEDRGGILRTEIAAAASYNKFLDVPEATREAITKRLSEQADGARIRLRERLANQTPEDV